MATKTQPRGATGEAFRLIDSIEETERSTLESVRTFVDTVNGAFPDLGDDGPRQKVIDSAFEMVEKLIGASNDLAQNIVKVTGDALERDGIAFAPAKKASPSTRKPSPPARKASASTRKASPAKRASTATK